MPDARFKCEKCKQELCFLFVNSGKLFNRRNKLVHLIRGDDKVIRMCGTVEKIDGDK